MSLTNKIFEYMAHGLPVLISLPGEAKQLVEESGCGMYYEPGSPSSLASAVVDLCDDPSRRDSMAQQASSVFRREYSAEVIYGRLADHLEAVIVRRNHPALAASSS
jgi:glycosyltransferase involved in cell wall biosynthesis